jgi:hypothetical protein
MPIYAHASGLRGLMLAILFTRPAPIVLLVLVVFYLSAYFAAARKMRPAHPGTSPSLAPEPTS